MFDANEDLRKQVYGDKTHHQRVVKLQRNVDLPFHHVTRMWIVVSQSHC